MKTQNSLGRQDWSVLGALESGTELNMQENHWALCHCCMHSLYVRRSSPSSLFCSRNRLTYPLFKGVHRAGGLSLSLEELSPGHSLAASWIWSLGEKTSPAAC